MRAYAAPVFRKFAAVSDPVPANGNGRRPVYDPRITLGNILTVIGGVFVGATLLVSVTLAYAALDKKADILAVKLETLDRKVEALSRHGQVPP